VILLSKEPLVAFQGEKGAYSEDACFKYFGSGVKTRPFLDFQSVFEAAEQDNVTHGIR
jgi:prephenate dehydratase